MYLFEPDQWRQFKLPKYSVPSSDLSESLQKSFRTPSIELHGEIGDIFLRRLLRPFPRMLTQVHMEYLLLYLWKTAPENYHFGSLL